MELVALSEVGLLAISTASIIFYGGRMVQRVDDLFTAFKDLAKRFEAAQIPEIDKRVCRLEERVNVLTEKDV